MRKKHIIVTTGEPQGLIDMILLAGRGHAPHTQTAQLLMAQPCSGKISATGTAGSVGAEKTRVVLVRLIMQ